MDPHLSNRQRECLAGLANGQSAKETARELGIAAVTVRVHLERAAEKLGAVSSTHAVVLALATGELYLEDRGPNGGNSDLKGD